jgi:RNA polymerase sigma-70 factor, ECF subfamily
MAAWSSPSVNEHGLVNEARQGSEAAWASLVSLHQEPVFRLAYLILRDAEEAQDVAQDAFIRAFLKLDQYDDSRPLRPWLLGITANLARNRRRSIGRYWSAVQRYLQANRDDAVAPPPKVNTAAADLWQAVQKLSAVSSEIIYLRYFLGLSEAEAAEALNIAPGTVKSRSHRALKKLRGIVERDYPELADERFIN